MKMASGDVVYCYLESAARPRSRLKRAGLVSHSQTALSPHGTYRLEIMKHLIRKKVWNRGEDGGSALAPLQ